MRGRVVVGGVAIAVVVAIALVLAAVASGEGGNTVTASGHRFVLRRETPPTTASVTTTVAPTTIPAPPSEPPTEAPTVDSTAPPASEAPTDNGWGCQGDQRPIDGVCTSPPFTAPPVMQMPYTGPPIPVPGMACDQLDEQYWYQDPALGHVGIHCLPVGPGGSLVWSE